MEIKRVGVIGAGQMGNGIAHVFARAGYDVLLNDISSDAVERAIATIRRNLDRQVDRDRISAEDRDATLARIRPEQDIAMVGKADLVIESATANQAVKPKIFDGLVP